MQQSQSSTAVCKVVWQRKNYRGLRQNLSTTANGDFKPQELFTTTNTRVRL